MAKKAAPGSAANHGFNDIIGIVLMGSAILLLIALLSYHPRDVSANGLPVNASLHNWIGPFGAWIAWFWLFCVGGAAYIVPFLLLFIGLGCFFQDFAYLRRRWPWALVFFTCCFGLLDLYHDVFSGFGRKMMTIPGGVLGQNLNRYIFNNFGRIGASILFFMLCFISALYLTNFRFGDWLRAFASRKATAPATGGAGSGEMTEEEKALEKRARELEKQARKLQEQVDKAGGGLGADLKPVPEPTVRDLSIPQNKSGAGRGKKSAEPSSEPAPPDEGVVIPAREVAAASSADVLGKKSGSAAKNDSKTDDPKA